MRESRNPFRLRASESIESDGTFLRLFGPGMLDLLSPDQAWDKPQVFRSAPGGGKTSLLRLFTPKALSTLYDQRRIDGLEELWSRMALLGAVDESGPKLLGVYLSCARNYATLDDLDLELARKDRVLFGLLNARVVLGCLRTALQLHGLSYPEDVERITAHNLDELGFAEFRSATSGKDLFEWAVSHEANICDAIDSFGSLDGAKVIGDDALGAVQLLRPNALSIDGKAVAQRSVLMLDDIQNLTHRQRRTLLRSVSMQRAGVAIWLAERFEALSLDEMLASGATEGRDYEEEILIERYWRRHPRKFEALVTNIGDRRVRAAVGVDVSSLDGFLEASLDGKQWQGRFQTILSQVRDRTIASASQSEVFSEWIGECTKKSGSAYEQAVAWRSLEILVHRELRKKQQAFPFRLAARDYEEKNDAAVQGAAEVFIASEFKVPYYFGISRLAILASSNLEQFLRLVGDEFEEVVAATIMRKVPSLSAERQDSILRKASDAVWREIPRRAKHGDQVARLLESVARFAHDTTYQSNAPYSPGVTGIAISMDDRSKLLDPGYLSRNEDHKLLAEVVAAALAQNLLEAQLDYRVKGGDWMVLNLNRLLCARFELPLQYGGFREKTLKELVTWLTKGYRPVAKTGTLT
jgi:hypothetical protein